METKDILDRVAGKELALEAFCVALIATLPTDLRAQVLAAFDQAAESCIALGTPSQIPDATLDAMRGVHARLRQAGS